MSSSSPALPTILSAITAACLLLSNDLCLAQATAPPRIAVIDLARAFQEHPETRNAEATLTADRNAAREAFKAKSESLKLVLQEHQELIRAGKKTEAAEKLKAANELESQIAALRTTQQRDLEQRFLREKERIVEAIRAAVRELNADRRYDLILDRSAESAFGLPSVIDAPGAEDITDAVMAAIVARQKKVAPAN